MYGAGRSPDEEFEELEEIEEIEEVVYVYVDEDGVEHEISAEDPAEYEVVEVVVESDDDVLPAEVEEALAEIEGEPEPEPEPEPEAPRTKGHHRGGRPPRTSSPGSTARPRARAGASRSPSRSRTAETERVVYVYVDDDGVEHEVSEDELDDFEMVDEPEDRTTTRP